MTRLPYDILVGNVPPMQYIGKLGRLLETQNAVTISGIGAATYTVCRVGALAIGTMGYKVTESKLDIEELDGRELDPSTDNTKIRHFRPTGRKLKIPRLTITVVR